MQWFNEWAGVNWQELRPEDLFVGCVSITIGLLALASAVFQWQPPYQLRTIQRLERQWGRLATRLALALVGLVLIPLGVAIALGFGPNKSL